MANLRYDKWHNTLHTLLLMGSLLVIASLVGWMLGGAIGLAALLVVTLVLFLLPAHLSGQVLMRMYRARPLPPQSAAWLYQIVDELTLRAGLPARPVIYRIPSSMLNAFATGSTDQPIIAVTDALLHQLEPRELVAVLAHEISHLRHHDLRVFGMADLLSRMTSVLSLLGQSLLLLNLPLILLGAEALNWVAVLLLVFSPHLSALAQLSLPRTREYEADRSAVELTGDPRALVSALAKLEQPHGGHWEQWALPGRKVPAPSLLRTHPTTEKRIEGLLDMDGGKTIPAAFTGRYVPADTVQVLFGNNWPNPRWRLTGLWY